jgi:hypothetical protein
MKKLLFLFFLFGCVHSPKSIRVYRSVPRCFVRVELRVDEKNNGEMTLSIASKKNTFKVEDAEIIYNRKEKIMLKKVDDKYDAWFEGVLDGDRIDKFKSMIKDSEIWTCESLELIH